MVLFMDGAIGEFSQIFILYSKRKIQHHQKKLLEKQTKRFPTKHFDFSHCAQIHSYIYENTYQFCIKSLLWTELRGRILSIGYRL